MKPGSAVDIAVQILESLPDAFVAVDRDWRLTYANHAAQKILGSSTENLIGKNVWNVWPNVLGTLYEEVGRRVMESRIAERFVSYRVEYDRWIENYVVPHREGIGIFYRDITDSVRAEQSLREQASLLDSTFDAMIVHQLDGKIVFWNKGAERKYGWTREEAIGQTAHTLLQTVFPEPLHLIIETVQRVGTWEGELSHVCRDGTVKTISSRWVRHYTISGQSHILEVNRDITERRRFLEEIHKERSLLKAVVETAIDAIVTIDGQGTILTANSAATRIFGYELHELVGQNVRMLMPSPFEEEHDQYLRNYHETGVRKIIGIGREVVGRRKDGTTFPVDLAVTETQLENGVLFTGFIRDITERKRIEEERRQLIRGARCLLWLSDVKAGEHDEIEWWSTYFPEPESALKFMPIDIRPEESFHEAWRRARFPEDTERCERIGWSEILHDRSYEQDFRVHLADDSVRWMHEYVHVERLDAGRRWRLVGVCTDVTKQREAELAIKEANQRLREAVKERTSELEAANLELEGFTYSVSHDLRAPLRAIGATSRLLREDYGSVLPSDALHLLDRQNAAAVKLGTLIDELLQLSRITRAEMTPQPFSLSEIAEEVADELLARPRTNPVKFVIEPDMTAYGDPTLLRFVLLNLMENAAKFSPNGGEVAVGHDDSGFFVRDHGIGFDTRYEDKLWKPFERLVSEREFPGTGIGLANVSRIIHKHGGRVWATSVPGEGSTFFFTLG